MAEQSKPCPDQSGYEILAKETRFRGYFRVDRYRLRHRTHLGGWTQPFSREIFERGHAVGVLLYDPKSDHVGLIEQFRPGAMAAGWDPWLIEIVAGIIDDDETPEDVAVREAREEAGIAITELIPICRYLVSPGGSSESMQLFCAKVESREFSGIHGLESEGEDIRLFALPVDEALGWVEQGRIANSMTVIALQWLALNRARLQK
jgi:ADP-ribose pyrophosphatase